MTTSSPAQTVKRSLSRRKHQRPLREKREKRGIHLSMGKPTNNAKSLGSHTEKGKPTLVQWTRTKIADMWVLSENVISKISQSGWRFILIF